MIPKNDRPKRLYAIFFTSCIVIGILAIMTAVPIIRRNSIHSVLLNGKVLLGYPDSIPTSLTLENNNGNYTAVVGDISASCACGGYYYMLTIPNQQSYIVHVYYKSNNSTRVCVTRLNISADSGNLNELIRCP